MSEQLQEAKPSIPNGSVVRFDYTLSVEGNVRETTLSSIGEAAGLKKPNRGFTPLTSLIGAKQLRSELEERLTQGKVGELITFTIPKAFGERTADKIRTVPMARFKKDGINPQVGMSVNMDNGKGTVTRVAGGRVVIDFNHEMAGKSLDYEVCILEVIDDELAKVKALLSTIPGAAEATTIEGDNICILLPDSLRSRPDWGQLKYRVAHDLNMATKNTKNIRFTEVFSILPPPLPPAPPLKDTAVQFATRAHGEQKRKDGVTPYIQHPVRVMEKLESYGIDDQEVLAAAVLHDVLEDTDVKADEILTVFGQRVLGFVQELTKDYASGARDETRKAYVNRFETASPEACLIKLVDRADNLRDDFSWQPDYKPAYAAEGLAILERISNNVTLAEKAEHDVPFGAALDLASTDLEKACEPA